MADEVSQFEMIARRSPRYSERQSASRQGSHPFELRSLHPRVSDATRHLFDDGHYAQATFEAFKLIEREVKTMARSSKSGQSLMMSAFQAKDPKVRLTEMSNRSEVDEQEGLRFLFAGAMLAIRNPRGHEVGVDESLDDCLDHLSLASLLLRRLDAV